MPGSVVLAAVHPDKAKSYSVTCMNEVCRWFNINWIVDVNPDGSLPAIRPHRKAYPKMPDVTAQVQAAADAEIARSMNNPR